MFWVQISGVFQTSLCSSDYPSSTAPTLLLPYWYSEAGVRRHNAPIPPLIWRGTLNTACMGSVHLPPLILHLPLNCTIHNPPTPSPNLIPGLSIVAVCCSDLSPALAMWAGPDLTPDNSSFWLIPQSECLLWSLDWFKYQRLYNAPIPTVIDPVVIDLSVVKRVVIF